MINDDADRRARCFPSDGDRRGLPVDVLCLKLTYMCLHTIPNVHERPTQHATEQSRSTVRAI